MSRSNVFSLFSSQTRIVKTGPPFFALLCALLASLLSGAYETRVNAADLATDVVYQNSAPTDSASARHSVFEFGDEIKLAGGEARKLSDFGFSYYGDFASGSSVTATLRLYKNDGPDVDSGAKTVLAPGTLLYESDPIAISAGYHQAIVSDLTLDVPASFTWTVTFSGVTQVDGNSVGLLYANPPTAGSSFDDFWEKKDGVWGIYRLGGNPVANFDALVRVFSFPLSLAAIPNVSIPKNTVSDAIPITINSITDTPGVLTVVATADNKTLVPDSAFQFSGTGLARTLKITPVTDQSGVAVVTINVTSDTGLTAKGTFTLRVTDAANPVQLSPIPDQVLAVGQASERLEFTAFGLSEAGGLAGASFVSTDTALLPDFAIVRDVIDLAAGVFFLQINPVAGKSGVATVTVTITSASGAKGTTSFKVTVGSTSTGPTVGITASKANAAEPSTDGEFTVTRSGDTSAALVVKYSVAGTASSLLDYTALTGTVTIPPGSDSAKIPVTVVDDPLSESSETVIATLTADAAYTIGSPASATVNIADNDSAPLPVVTVATATPNISEPNGVGKVVISRTGASLLPLTVTYIVRGTATPDADYTALSGVAIIPIGASSVELPITVKDDTLAETDETVEVVVTATGPYEVGTPSSATITIGDDDSGPKAPMITQQPLPVSAAGGKVTFTVAATGTAPLKYQWIKDDLALADDATYSGTKTDTLSVNVTSGDQAGDYKVIVSNNVGDTPSVVAKLTLSGAGGAPPEILLLIDDHTVDGGAPLTFDFFATDPEGASLIITGRAEDSEIVSSNAFTFASTDGFAWTCTLTPSAIKGGTTKITITVSDGFNKASASFNLTVRVTNQPPTLAKTIPDQTATAGVAFSFAFAADTFADADTGDLLTYTSTNLPVWLTFNADTRAFTGLPGSTNAGISIITVTAKDKAGATVSTTFNITVTAPNTPPVISKVSNQTTASGTATPSISFTVSDKETPADHLVVVASSSNLTLLPGVGVNLSGTAENRTLVLTPAAGQTGVVTVSLEVFDPEGLSAVSKFDLVVSAADTPNTKFIRRVYSLVIGRDPDEATAKSLDSLLNEGKSRSQIAQTILSSPEGLQRLVNDMYVAYLRRQATLTELATSVSFIQSIGRIDQFIAALISSPEYFNVRSGGDNARFIREAMIDLLGRNPTVSDSTFLGGLLNAGSTRTVVANILISSSEYRVGFVQSLFQMYLRRAATSSEVANYVNLLGAGGTQVGVKSGILGLDEFFNASQTFPENTAPVASGQSLSTTSGSTISILLSATDVDGDILTYSLVSGAQLGTLSGTPPILTYKAGTNGGNDTFTFKASDGTADSAAATVSISIKADNSPPVISTIPNQTVDEDNVTALIPFNVSDDSTASDLLTVTASSSNSSIVKNTDITLTGSGTNRMVQVHPQSNANGTVDILITAKDVQGLSSTNKFTLTVQAVNDAPSLSLPVALNRREGIALPPILIGVSDVDNPAANLTIRAEIKLDQQNSLFTLDGITFTGGTIIRTLHLTPTPGQSGSATITVIVSDGDKSSSKSLRVTIAPPAPEIVTAPSEITVAEGKSAFFTVEATGNDLTYLWSDQAYNSLPNNAKYAGVDTPTLEIRNVKASDAKNYHVLVRNKSGSKSATIRLRVISAPVSISNPRDYTIHESQTATLRVDVRGTAPLNYQWFLGPNAIPGEVGKFIKTQKAGDYSCLVTNLAGSVTVGTFHVKVLTSLKITSQPQSVTNDLGGNATFKVAVEGTGPFKYQWRKNGVNLSGATNDTLTITSIKQSDGAAYSVAVTDSGVPKSVLSDPAALLLNLSTVPFADNFADRGTITGNSGAGVAVNTGATLEEPEPDHGDSFLNSSSVWVKWVAPGNGVARFSTAGSTFNTYLGVYTGSTVGALTSVASNDNGGGYFTSAVSVNATAGTEYQIVVTGVNGATGNIVFDWSFEAQAAAPPTVSVNPTAIIGILSLSPLTFDKTILNATATNPNGDVSELTYQWFKGVSPGGTAVSGGTSSSVVVDKPGVYYVRVSNQGGSVDSQSISVYARLAISAASFNGSSGRFEKQDVNDQLGVGTMETAISAVLVADTTDSTSSPGEPIHCGVIGGASQWFTYRPKADGVLTVTTDGSDFDTVIAAYTGNSTDYSKLTLVTCDNDSGPDGKTSTMTFAVTAGTDYYIAADGAGGATGLLLLKYSLVIPASISVVADQSGDANQTIGPIAIQVASTTTDVTNLVLFADSSNLNLISEAGIVFSGAGADRTLSITPIANQSGEATITLTVSDGVNLGTRFFKVTINAANSAPFISSLQDQSVAGGLPVGPLSFAVGDAETAADALTVTATSSNTALVAADGLLLEGTGEDRSLTVTTKSGQSGSATITLTVKDTGGATASSSFVVTTVALAGPPIITQPPSNLSVAIGGQFTLSVAASGDEPLSYQWSFNGAPIDGATNSTLSYTNVNIFHSGVYSVEVSNAAGSTSDSSQVTVVLPELPQPTISIAFEGGAFSLLVDNLPPGNYSIQTSENLTDWTEVAAVNGDFGFATYTDENAGTTAKRFFRVVAAPAQ